MHDTQPHLSLSSRQTSSSARREVSSHIQSFHPSRLKRWQHFEHRLLVVLDTHPVPGTCERTCKRHVDGQPLRSAPEEAFDEQGNLNAASWVPDKRRRQRQPDTPVRTNRTTHPQVPVRARPSFRFGQTRCRYRMILVSFASSLGLFTFPPRILVFEHSSPGPECLSLAVAPRPSTVLIMSPTRRCLGHMALESTRSWLRPKVVLGLSHGNLGKARRRNGRAVGRI